MRALIVGGKGGIGAALVEKLYADNSCEHITIWQRNVAVTNAAYYKRITRVACDLTSERSLVEAASTLGTVDLVIVTTGLLQDEARGVRPEKTWRAIDPDAMRRSFEINTIGSALIAKHVLPQLPRDRRAVFAVLSARVGSISDNRLGGWHSYRAAKAALNQLVRCFAIELAVKAPQAMCVALHPGTVDTGLSKPFQSGVPGGRLFSSDVAAQHLLDVVSALTPAQSGRIFDWSGTEIAP